MGRSVFLILFPAIGHQGGNACLDNPVLSQDTIDGFHRLHRMGVLFRVFVRVQPVAQAG